MADHQLQGGGDPADSGGTGTPIEQPVEHLAADLGNNQLVPVNPPIQEPGGMVNPHAALPPVLVPAHHAPENVHLPLLKSLQGRSPLTGETIDG